jgi:hypothetical protein
VGVKTMKKVTSILLVFVMVLSLVGSTDFTISSYAAESSQETVNTDSTDIKSLSAASEDETSSMTENATTEVVDGTQTDETKKSEQKVTDEAVSTQAVSEAQTEETTEVEQKVTGENTTQPVSEATTEDAVSEEEISGEEQIQTFSLDEASMDDTSTTWAEADGALVAAATDIQEGFEDFTQYMTSHVITVNGKTVASGSQVDPTEDFTLTLQFKLELEDMMKNGLQYYYVLPEHISIGNLGSATSQITLYNSRRVAIGTYYIKDDVMYVTFPGYYEEVVSNFTQGASWVGTNNLTQIPVDWGTDKEVFLLDNCDLKIIKNASGYKNDADGNLVNSYKITVKPKTSGASIDNITFSDTFTSTYLKWYEDYFGDGKDIKISYYTEDGTLTDTEYYSIDDVTKHSGTTYKTNIYPISISDGGYFVVEYAGMLKLEDRYALDASNKGDSYTNYAQASYPFYNPTSKETETVSADTKIYGTYSSEGSWILKSAGDDTKTKVMNGDTKTIVPYTVTVNKFRRYSMGGGIVNDSITGFGSGDVKQDVVYDTSATAETYVVMMNKNLSSSGETVNQTWITLDESLYNQLTALKGTSDTQLETLRKNASLQAAIVDAINKSQGTSYTSFTDEAALKYVFTTESAHDFVWFMPMDEVPTTYTIHYSTIVDSEVGSFSNGASLWYTEYDSTPPGPGAGWTKPVKKVLNASKSNAGVYVGSDGNYYVDYTITVGVEAGSAGFNDIFVYDSFPTYKNVPIGDSGTKTTVVDWLCFPDGNTLDIDKDSAIRGNENDAAVQSIATISSDSTDPAVQSIVDNAYVLIPSAVNYPVNRALGSLMKEKDEVSANSNYYILTRSSIYSGDTAAAGQFNIGVTTSEYSVGDTFSVKGVAFLLGNLPGTEEGYDIDIKYTMQINPCLIEALPDLLEESGDDYLYNKNTMSVKTSVNYGDGTWWWTYGTGGSGHIQSASSGYWIGKPDTTPILDKDVKSYDKSTKTLTYKVDINEQKTVEGENNTYELTDNLNISGVKYKANSLTLYDGDNKIIYTNVKGKSVASKYKNIATYTVTNSDTSANNFKIVLDNSSGVLTTSDNKLISMYMEYGVDFSGEETDVTIMNTVALRMKGYDKDNDVYYDELLGEDTSEYAVDKALDKGILSGQQPTASNNYTAGFYIDINPDSDNAYQLKNLKVGDTFTVRDTLSDSLLLDIDNVKIYQTVGTKKTDITSSCKLSYDIKTGVFDMVVPVTNTKATYRMEYYAKVMGASGTKITISNSAVVLGTDVKEDKVKKDVYVPSASEDAEATTSEIRFVKYDRYNVESRVKATFDLYYYDTTAKDWVLLTGEDGYDKIVTGDDGTASIKNTTIVSSQPIRLVTRGYWYKLVEVAAEGGYMVDSTPIYYYVMNGTTQPNNVSQVVGTEKYSLVELSTVGATVAELPIIYASNHKLSFDVSKVDSGTLSNITGAEFTLYSDKACTKVLDVQEDEDGIISFNDVDASLDTTLYMKETKTPEGYIESDTVYAITFEAGYITKAVAITDDVEEELSSTDTTERSVVTVKNDAVSGRIKVSKTVNASTQALKDRDEFSFSMKLYDEEGNLLTGSFPAVKTDADGNETETTLRSEVVFTLSNGESICVNSITPGTTYKVQEIADNRYSVSGKVVDEKGKDSKNISSTGVASGTVETGGYDEVQYTNTLLRSLEVVKQCVTDTGEALDIPDGHQIIITSSYALENQVMR